MTPDRYPALVLQFGDQLVRVGGDTVDSPLPPTLFVESVEMPGEVRLPSDSTLPARGSRDRKRRISAGIQRAEPRKHSL